MFRQVYSLFLICSLILLPASRLGAEPGRAGEQAENRLYLPVVNRASPPIVVVDSLTVRARNGFCRVIGEVRNVTAQPLYDVDIVVDVFQGDVFTATITGTTLLPAVLPGQPNVFDITTLFNDLNNPLDCSRTRIMDWQETSSQDYRALTLVNLDAQWDWLSTTVTAEVRNDTGVRLETVAGAIWSLDNAYPNLPESIAAELAPGEVVTFTAALWYLPANYIDTIRVTAQGIAAP